MATNTLSEDLCLSLYKVQRGWIRRPATVFIFIVILIPISLIGGAINGLGIAFREFFMLSWRGEIDQNCLIKLKPVIKLKFTRLRDMLDTITFIEGGGNIKIELREEDNETLRFGKTYGHISLEKVDLTINELWIRGEVQNDRP